MKDPLDEVRKLAAEFPSDWNEPKFQKAAALALIVIAEELRKMNTRAEAQGWAPQA